MPYLHAPGFDVTLSPLYTPEFFRFVYQPGHYVQKVLGFGGLSLKRLTSLYGLSRFDVILLYREIFPIGPAFVERLLALRGRPPIVFDFDDALFLPSVSDANRFIATLKQPSKVKTIIRHADHIIAGNEYLAGYARRFNPAVTAIPTSVDTTRFVPRSDMRPGNGSPTGELVIGGIGRPTTGRYIRGLESVLRRAAERYRFSLRLSGIGEAVSMNGVTIDNTPWSLEREVELFNTCDIGVYPLPDDEWAKGKCGFKAIQFMACGVPVIASAVGVNREIIEDGVNGFLASSPEEWTAALKRLIADPGLRRRIGAAGRRTIEERYSLAVHAPRLASFLSEIAGGGPATGWPGAGA